MKTVLTIAGSDSGGGAGIQADIKTISALGCYAASAITAITVQNTLGVSAVYPVEAAVVEAQIEAVLSDIGADAVKIGMLCNAPIVDAVARQLRAHRPAAVVLDPVMVSTSGHPLLAPEAIEALLSRLFPLVTVITPNIPEAELLLGGRHISDPAMMPLVARELSAHYGTSVLLKAGHIEGTDLTDIFYDAAADTVTPLPATRVDTRNTHGTGCTMSSAFAAMMAKGATLTEAAKGAKAYVNDAIVSGARYKIGQGIGPVDHFFSIH